MLKKTSLYSVAIVYVLCAGFAFTKPVRSEFARSDGGGASTEFVRYDGPQPRFAINPIAKGHPGFAIPVYFTFPEREYHVLGFVYEHGSHVADSDALRTMAIAAKLHGADAIVLRRLTDKMRAAMWGDRPAIFAHAVAVKWGPAPL